METCKLLSGCALSRALDVSIPRIARAIQRGAILPDYVSGTIRLFSSSRLDEIRKALNLNNPRTAR